MSAPESLFPDLDNLEPIDLTPHVEPKVSPDRRRTLRQRADIAAGRHPVTGGRLHPDPDATCGNCHWRAVIGHRNRSYAKCFWVTPGWDVERFGWPRVSHSASSDIRAWWPGCADHEFGDPKVGPDAARWKP